MNTPPAHDSQAVRLAVAIKRLRTRLREAAFSSASGLSLTQFSILRHLRLEGPTTAATLATTEYISQQAIAQNLTELKRAGLVEATPDPQDGRKRLINVTAAGNTLFDAVSASRNAWLADAIELTVTDREQPALDKAIELLERLADADNSGKTR